MQNQPMIGGFDALLPGEMAVKAEELGVRKAALPAGKTFLLAILAGAFIAIGALFATTVSAAAAGTGLPFGVTRLLAGLVFSTGLILVVVGGAELFTGNNLISIAFASGKVSWAGLLRNWAIVYAGNFAGAALTALLVYLGKQYTFGGGAIGLTALAIGEAKSGLEFIQAVALGMMCNALVCMAVWLCYSARSTTDKILAIIPPITAFVAAGFEHSVANMYFIPVALMVKFGDPAFTEAAGAYPNLTVMNFLVNNLLPVTIGNIIGGAVMVGLVYWLVYLRK